MTQGDYENFDNKQIRANPLQKNRKTLQEKKLFLQ